MPRRRSEPITERPERLSVYLDRKTRSEFVAAADHERTSMTALLERLIRDYLRTRRKR